MGSDAGGITTWKNLVDFMNRYRAKHGAPPLKWDTKLYKSASAWAKNCKFEHSHGWYGENLAWNFENWKQVVDAWYGEVRDQLAYWEASALPAACIRTERIG